MPDINELFQKELAALVARDEAMVLIERSIAALDNVYAAAEVRTWLIDATRILFPEPEPEPLVAALNPNAAKRDRAASNTAAERLLAAQYQKAAKVWVDRLPLRQGDQPSTEDVRAFSRSVRRETEAVMNVSVRALIEDEFNARELPLPTARQLDRMVDTAIGRTLQNNEIKDIAATLYRAKRLEGDPRATGYSLERLLGESHAKEVSGSLFRSASDDTERQIFQRGERIRRGPHFTGRRQWVSGPGRHSELNGAVAEKGEGWQLSKRTIGNKTLPAKRVMWPRQSPEDTAEWSGSTSFVRYEVIENGQTRWL